MIPVRLPLSIGTRAREREWKAIERERGRDPLRVHCEWVSAPFDVICTFQWASGSRPMALLIISESKTTARRGQTLSIWALLSVYVISSMTCPPISYCSSLPISSLKMMAHLGWLNNFLIKRIVYVIYWRNLIRKWPPTAKKKAGRLQTSPIARRAKWAARLGGGKNDNQSIQKPSAHHRPSVRIIRSIIEN